MVPLRSQMCAALAAGLARRCLSPAPDRGFACPADHVRRFLPPAPMISAHLRCSDQRARLDGPAAWTVRWSVGSLQGQNVVVVGGNRAVSRSIIEAALSEGATVLAVARGAAALTQLSNETSGVKTLAVDATKDSTPDEVFDALKPDVLVICAGALAPSAPVHELSWEAFSVNWETDVKALFLFCKGRAPRSAQAGDPGRSYLQWRVTPRLSSRKNDPDRLHCPALEFSDWIPAVYGRSRQPIGGIPFCLKLPRKRKRAACGLGRASIVVSRIWRTMTRERPPDEGPAARTTPDGCSAPAFAALARAAVEADRFMAGRRPFRPQHTG
jgi:NAD(P)-dependent dehydrogenase (short-subunit alcohol dehydrogenase family)